MKRLVLFIGIQASGKSTLYYERFQGSYTHINLDRLHTRNKERIKFLDAVSKGEDIVIDNTNPTKAERQRYIPLAKENGYRIIAYYFQSCIKDCIDRNERRDTKTKIPCNAIAHTHRILELPSYNEGFDEMYYVRMGDKNMVVEKWGDSDEI